MSQYKDYQGPTVNNSGCSYSKLSNVYNGQSANMQIPEQAYYDVPKLCTHGPGPNYPPKYSTLTHDQQYLCGGYFSMKGAYPHATCTTCDAQYVKRPCNGRISCDAVEGYRKQ